ncbi:hypothetical protein [Nodularia spumigena]|uniref:hypothetical protein n=1 Tax=Nodularia spumigena TaxID=70799 RepID=UPI002B1EC581|nr:hypothetical protein [Nodularia spumigena]MEA5557615.1 hypothetical protein [Nodularia spumigena CH309]
MLDLRLRDEPLERDYRLVGRLLDLAQLYAPEDGGLARERVEAWYQAGDLERVIDACRDVLRNDPSDTVAQLRLFTSQISRLNTAQQRLSVYERILGPDGATIDPSVRSRLALDAALLLRERGDTQGFVDRLSMATGLDSTNKEAAALAATYYASRATSQSELLELYSNLLYADPFDPAIYTTIAQILADVGSYTQARRFYDLSVILSYAEGISPGIDVAVEQLVLKWHTDGPESIVKELNVSILTQRDSARRTIESLDKQGIPSTGVTPPSDIRLPIPLEQIRLLAANASGDEATVQSSAADLETSVDKLIENLTAQVTAGMMSTEDVTELASNAISELLLVTSLAGVQSDAMRAAMTSFLARRDVSVNVREQLAPWVDFRAGEYQRALEKFEALSGRSQAVDVGLALCHEALGRADRADELLRQVVESNRLSAVSTWARAKRMGTGGTWGDDPSDVARASTLIARGVPDWLDRMIRETRSFMILSAEAVPTDPSTPERPVIRLVLRNTAALALAVGPDRSVNSRMLVSPKLEFGLASRPDLQLPEVVNIDRRLRLGQGEALELRIWPENGYSGWLAETYAARTVRARWGLIQGFRLGSGSMYVPGAMSLATQTGQYTRNPLFPASNAAELMEQIAGLGSLGVNSWYALSARVRGAALLPSELGGLSQPELEAIAVALKDAYPALASPARIVLLAGLPHGRQSPMFNVFDKGVESERDEHAIMLALITRVSTPDNPLLAYAESSPGNALREVARVVRSRLENGEPHFANVGPGLEAMAGPGIRAAGVKVAPETDEQRR